MDSRRRCKVKVSFFDQTGCFLAGGRAYTQLKLCRSASVAHSSMSGETEYPQRSSPEALGSPVRYVVTPGHGPENITRLRRFAISIIKGRGGQSVPQKMRQLMGNVRLVFDYLRMTENSCACAFRN
jgi:hypothetical protein